MSSKGWRKSLKDEQLNNIREQHKRRVRCFDARGKSMETHAQVVALQQLLQLVRKVGREHEPEDESINGIMRPRNCGGGAARKKRLKKKG